MFQCFYPSKMEESSYVIPYEKVKNIIEDPKDKKANLNSNEFLICELKSDCFDIIDIEKLFDKDFFERED